MVAIKAIASIFGQPVLIGTILTMIAAVLWLAGRRRSAAGITLSAIVVFYLGSISAVADAILHPLEARFAPLSEEAGLSGIAFIVVLGSGYFPRDNVPVTAAIDGEGLARIVEAVRLARRYGTTIVVSGGARAGAVAPASGYAVLARELGIGEDSLLVSPEGLDTHAEALAIARLVNGRRFILVTSAAHMPRAMALLRRIGLDPLPAPTAQHVFPLDFPGLRRWFPSTNGMRKIEIALHEYLGLLAIRLGWD